VPCRPSYYSLFRATNQQQNKTTTQHDHSSHGAPISGFLSDAVAKLPLGIRLLISSTSISLHQAVTFLDVTELQMVAKSGP
jgi:hypothetical protein